MQRAPTARHLDALAVDQEGYRLLFTKDAKGAWSMWYTDPADLIQYFATSKANRYDVYISIGISDAKIGVKRRIPAENIIALPALWADIDLHDEAHKKTELPETVEQALALIPEAGLPVPSMIVHTGHGLNPYWLLEDPWIFTTDQERHDAHRVIDGLQTAIQGAALQHGWHLDTVSYINTTLRLVGSDNHHVKPKVPVRWLAESGLKYKRAELESLAGLSLLPSLQLISSREGKQGRAQQNQPLAAQLIAAQALWEACRPVEPWPGLWEPHRCLSHDDGENPDAEFIVSAAGHILERCYHDPRSRNLQALYAKLILKTAAPSDDKALARMRNDMYLKFGAVARPAVLCDPVPEGASETEARVYLDVIAALEHNWVGFPGEPVMYTANFGAVRLDLHQQAVKEALIALRKYGVLRRVDKVPVGNKLMANRWLTEAEAKRRESECQTLSPA